MVKTTVYLPEELGITLADVALRLKMTKAEAIRQALASFCQQNAPARSKFIGCVSSGKVPAKDLDKWLASNWKNEVPRG